MTSEQNIFVPGLPQIGQTIFIGPDDAPHEVVKIEMEDGTVFDAEHPMEAWPLNQGFTVTARELDGD